MFSLFKDVEIESAASFIDKELNNFISLLKEKGGKESKLTKNEFLKTFKDKELNFNKEDVMHMLHKGHYEYYTINEHKTQFLLKYKLVKNDIIKQINIEITNDGFAGFECNAGISGDKTSSVVIRKYESQSRGIKLKNILKKNYNYHDMQDLVSGTSASEIYK